MALRRAAAGVCRAGCCGCAALGPGTGFAGVNGAPSAERRGAERCTGAGAGAAMGAPRPNRAAGRLAGDVAVMDGDGVSVVETER